MTILLKVSHERATLIGQSWPPGAHNSTQPVRLFTLTGPELLLAPLIEELAKTMERTEYGDGSFGFADG